MSITEFHQTGGILFMSVLSISLTLILAIAIVNILRLSRCNYHPTKQILTIGDIKSVSVFAVMWGILGQSIGLFSALQAMEAAGDVPPAMIYGGLKVSFLTTLYGMFIFLLGWLIAFILNNWQRKENN